MSPRGIRSPLASTPRSSSNGRCFLPRQRQELFLLLMAGVTMTLVWFQDFPAHISAPAMLDDPSSRHQLLSSQHQALRRNSVADENRGKPESAARTLTPPSLLLVQQAKTTNRTGEFLQSRNREEDSSPVASEKMKGRTRGGGASTDSVDPADRQGAENRSDREEDKASGGEKAGEANHIYRGHPKDFNETSVRDQQNRSVSPYELRWPKYKLPVWSTKTTYATNKPERSICFVHVGKAAGSSVGCSLGFQLHCEPQFANASIPGLLPSSTTNMMHNDVNDCALNHDYYLFTVRHPIERIKSWWLYDLKYLDGIRKGDCAFETLNDLAEIGLSQQPYKTTKECHKKAMGVVRGEVRYGNHAYHNYRWYLQQVPFNATLAAIRAEHMLADWNAFEQHLAATSVSTDGGREKVLVQQLPSANENKRYNAQNKYVSELGTSWLCAALCDEIQAYKHILARSVNLRPGDVDQSFRELRATCPREVDQAACPK